MTLLLKDLEKEWAGIERRPLPPSWHDDHALKGFADFAALIEHVQRRRHEAESDCVLAALVRRAASDQLAAKTLLYVLMPGIKGLVRRFRRLGEDDAASEVVSAVWEQIRSYRLDRRPAKIAANVLGDTFGQLWRRHLRDIPTDPVGDTEQLELFGGVLGCIEEHKGSAERLTDFVVAAICDGFGSNEDGQVLLRPILEDIDVHQLAAAMGEDYEALRKRRLRMKNALTEAARGAEGNQSGRRRKRSTDGARRPRRVPYLVA